MSEDEPTTEEGGAPVDEVDPESLKQAAVELDVAVEALERSATRLEETAACTDPIERETSTLRDLAERFEERWLALETGAAGDGGADTDGESPDPVGPSELADAETAREDALQAAVAALEVARTELEQEIEDLERRL